MNSIGDGGEPGAGAVGERTRRASGDGPPDPAGTVGAAGGEDDAIACASKETEICDSTARQRGRDTLRYHKRLFGQRIAIQCYTRIATLSNERQELDSVQAIERRFRGIRISLG